MRDVKLIKRGGRYFVEDFDGEVTGIYEDPICAIDEWEYFEYLNTNSEINKRFLTHATPIKEIEEIVNKLKNDI